MARRATPHQDTPRIEPACALALTRPGVRRWPARASPSVPPPDCLPSLFPERPPQRCEETDHGPIVDDREAGLRAATDRRPEPSPAPGIVGGPRRPLRGR